MSEQLIVKERDEVRQRFAGFQLAERRHKYGEDVVALFGHVHVGETVLSHGIETS